MGKAKPRERPFWMRHASSPPKVRHVSFLMIHQKTFQAKCLEKTPIIQGTAVHTPLTITNDDLLTSLLFVTLMRKMVSPETLSGTLEFDGSGIETRDLPFSRTGMSEWIF
ncbi:hypothetical protein ALP18_200027 [Pseudomonas amygdali pv. myricae]|nr:hypothetical protein ALP46_200247 [Pseudomonas amygdali pv. myricae]RMU95618.1 hypothetical protein ALP18_200027 [Pseudomonas amygdali pv. myricae]